MGFFAKPKTGASPFPKNQTFATAPAPSPIVSSSPASTTIRTPSSAAGSSPMNALPKIGAAGTNGSTKRMRDGSPLKRSTIPAAEEGSENDLSPLPELSSLPSNAVASSSKADATSSTPAEMMDIDEAEEGNETIEGVPNASPVIVSNFLYWAITPPGAAPTSHEKTCG